MADNLMFLVVLTAPLGCKIYDLTAFRPCRSSESRTFGMPAQTNMLSGVVEVVGCIPYSHDVQRLSNFWTASQFGSAMHVPNLHG